MKANVLLTTALLGLVNPAVVAQQTKIGGQTNWI
jgi:hypothetical protein